MLPPVGEHVEHVEQPVVIEILPIDIEYQPCERREQHQQRVEARKAQQPVYHFPRAGMDNAAREQTD